MILYSCRLTKPVSIEVTVIKASDAATRKPAPTYVASLRHQNNKQLLRTVIQVSGSYKLTLLNTIEYSLYKFQVAWL